MNSIELAKELIVPGTVGSVYEVQQLAADFLELVELCKDVMHQIHTQKGCWPAEVDNIDDYLEKLK